MKNEKTKQLKTALITVIFFLIALLSASVLMSGGANSITGSPNKVYAAPPVVVGVKEDIDPTWTDKNISSAQAAALGITLEQTGMLIQVVKNQHTHPVPIYCGTTKYNYEEYRVNELIQNQEVTNSYGITINANKYIATTIDDFNTIDFKKRTPYSNNGGGWIVQFWSAGNSADDFSTIFVENGTNKVYWLIAKSYTKLTDSSTYKKFYITSGGFNETGEGAMLAPDILTTKAPTPISGLIYNTQPQIGVATGIGYTLTGNTATTAGDHWATATLTSDYEWTDAPTKEPRKIKYTIAQADQTDVGLNAISTTYNGSEIQLSGKGGSSTVTGYTYTKVGGTGGGTLTQNGILTVSKAGTFIIDVTKAGDTNYKSKTTQVVFTVSSGVSSLTFKNASVDLPLNETYTNTFNVKVGNGAITYSSSDSTIASVDATSGQVTAHKFSASAVTITARMAVSDCWNATSATYTIKTTQKTLPNLADLGSVDYSGNSRALPSTTLTIPTTEFTRVWTYKSTTGTNFVACDQANFTNAGVYRLTVTAVANKSYTGSNYKDYIVNKINQSTPITLSSDTTFWWKDGYTPRATGGNTTVLTYAIANGTGNATLNTTLNITKAGTLTLTVTSSADNNYNILTQNFTLTVKTNTVTFDHSTNGGQSCTSQNLSGKIGATINLPTATKQGWTFVGWGNNANDTNKINSYTLVEGENAKLYAIYSKQLTINFYINSETKQDTLTIYNNTSTFDVTKPALSNLDNNWTALGWRDDTTFGDATYDSVVATKIPKTTTTATATINLYAIYSRVVTLSYNINGANTPAPTNQTATQYRNTNYSKPAFTLENALTHNTMLFDKWAEGSATGTKYTAKSNYEYINSTSSVIMYATWQLADAKIGDTVFKTLTNAIENVTANQTILLLQDVSTDELTVNKSFIINGQTHNITTKGANVFAINSAYTLTLQNVTITGIINNKGILKLNGSVNITGDILLDKGSNVNTTENATNAGAYAITLNKVAAWALNDKLILGNNGTFTIKGLPNLEIDASINFDKWNFFDGTDTIVGGMKIDRTYILSGGKVVIDGLFVGDKNVENKRFTVNVEAVPTEIVFKADDKFTAQTTTMITSGKKTITLTYKKTTDIKINCKMIITIPSKETPGGGGGSGGGNLTGEVEYGKAPSDKIFYKFGAGVNDWKIFDADSTTHENSVKKQLPNDILIDDNGYVTFRLDEFEGDIRTNSYEYTVFVGKRAVEPGSGGGENIPNRDEIIVTDRSITIPTLTGYEYSLLDVSQNLLVKIIDKEWLKGEDGKTITWKPLTIGKEYTVKVRKIGTDTLLPGIELLPKYTTIIPTIEKLKEDTKKDIDTNNKKKAEEDIKSLINLPQTANPSTDPDKDKAIIEIGGLVENAKNEISKPDVDTPEEINIIKNKLKEEIKKVVDKAKLDDLEYKKKKTIGELDNFAEVYLLPNGDKGNEYDIGQIKAVIDDAKKKISNATTTAEVDDLLQKAKENIQNEKPIAPKAYIDYFEMLITQLDPNTNYTITVDGKDYKFTTDSKGSISLKGVDLGKEYDFIGKELKIKRDAKTNPMQAESVSKTIQVDNYWVFTINYNDSATAIKTFNVRNNQTAPIVSVDPVRAGYIFTGWFKDSSCAVEFSFKYDKITSATTIYAGWLQESLIVDKFVVTLKVDGSPDDVKNISKNIIFSQPSKPTKPNMAFEGWYTDVTFLNKYYFNSKLSSDLTLYAKFVANKLSITMPNGEISQIDYGSKLPKPTDPVKDGFIFAGWFIDEGLNNSIVFEDDKSRDGIYRDTKLYPKFVEKTYDVSGKITGDIAGADVTIHIQSPSKPTVKVDNNGNYTIKDVPDGTFRLIVTCIKGAKTTIVTDIIIVNGKNITVPEIQIKNNGLNSTVEIKENAPDVAVGGLNDIFNGDNLVSQAEKNEAKKDNSTIEIKFVVENTGNDKNLNNFATTNNKVIGSYLDFSLFKITSVNGNQQKNYISTLDNVLKVMIPLSSEMLNKSNYIIYRIHDGLIEQILMGENNKNKDGEFVALSEDAKFLIIYTKNFSSYAIAYDEPVPVNSKCFIHWLLLVLIVVFLVLIALFTFFFNKKCLANIITWAAYVVALCVFAFFVWSCVADIILWIIGVILAVLALLGYLFFGDKQEFVPDEEEPIAEEPIAEEPIAEEPIAEEPIAEEPIAEEPIAEEPIAEEPIAEEPIAEEPIAEEPIAEEPIAEEPIAEEPIAEEPIAEEPIAEEPIVSNEVVATETAFKENIQDIDEDFDNISEKQIEFIKNENEQKRLDYLYAKRSGGLVLIPITFKLCREDILDYMQKSHNKYILYTEADNVVFNEDFDETSADIFPVEPNIKLRKNAKGIDSLRCGDWCFSLVYVRSDTIKFVARLDNEYAKNLTKQHTGIKRSLFPKGDNWYDIIIDGSYNSKKDIFNILYHSYLFVLKRYYQLIDNVYVTDVSAAENEVEKISEQIINNESVVDSDFEVAIKERKKSEKQYFATSSSMNMTRLKIISYVSRTQGEDATIIERDRPASPATLKINGATYGLVYQGKQIVRLNLKLEDEFADILQLTHPLVRRAKFPKGANWYIIEIDSSFTNDYQAYKLLTKSRNFVKNNNSKK